MKKLVLLTMVLLLLVPSVSFASWCKSKSLNTVEKDRYEVGAGVDLIVFEGKEGEVLNKVTVEYKYDWQNADNQVYTVATMKLADIIGLFKKDE